MMKSEEAFLWEPMLEMQLATSVGRLLGHMTLKKLSHMLLR